MSPWACLAVCSSDRSAARSTGRLVVALLNPAAPEASACSAAGIHWALEDLVASCLHHRQWHEVQARSKPPLCLSTAPACACPAMPVPACPGLLLLAPHEVGVCHRLCPVSFPDFVCLSEAVRALPVSFRGGACTRVSCRSPDDKVGQNHTLLRMFWPTCWFWTPSGADRSAEVAQRHSMQDTQPETSVPSNAI